MILFAVAVIVLIAWTILDGEQWDRDIVNEVTGESYGKCSAKGPVSLIMVMMCIAFLQMILALVAAWRTRDVEDSFSESSWIFGLTFFNVQLWLILSPMLWVLTDVNTLGHYLCMTLLVWSFSMASVLMIMAPKVLAYLGLSGGEAVMKRG